MTDSNSGIMPAEGEKSGIHVIPMPILIDERTYYEGYDITTEEFYEKLTRGVSATTSQPSPAAVIDMWRSLLKTHDEVVFIPMSSGLSKHLPDRGRTGPVTKNLQAGRVHVVDNHRISVTQAQSVYDARILEPALQ